ncbi:MAG: methionine--tRNA ligase [Patescibacteria group bacterium]|nr:methionine--tRNA ligase [Patescibacteria group bacterium]
MTKKEFYITTSIAYANAAPHIGFALESLQADAIARYERQSGAETFFLTGTDEHGSKIARAAEAAGKDPGVFVDANADRFRSLKDALNLSWDGFIRTSDRKTHWPVAQELWQRLEKSGDLYRKTYRGLYCVGHEAFVTPKDLVDGKCADHKKEPEVIEEENWFFRLSKYTGEIELKIKNDELLILPESRKNEILSLLKQGLEDISFSRPAKDLSWGVPVPGDETQTMYVWADALSNYISGHGGIGAWQKHPADVHLIGKDILRFHAAIWPAMLLSAKLPLPKSLFVHGHILVEGEKMSKSVGNVVDPFELVEKYGTDPVRYYLLREIPSDQDGDFGYDKFEERYNGDLANGLGNFAARVTTLASGLGSFTIGEIDASVVSKIEVTERHVAEKMKNFRLSEALMAVFELIQFGDRYANDHKPWDKNLSPEEKRKILGNLVEILRSATHFLRPFLPGTAEKIAGAVEVSDGTMTVKKIEPLFPRLTA